MILEYENENNSHYFYVMAWKNNYLGSAPVRKKKFDIYDDALEYFNKALSDLGDNAFVRMFEYIGGKRKIIANSEDGLL